MAKRLVKVAKELNVGTTTIVEHLLNSGFEIENKPTAKVSDEMEQELLREFQKSIAIKKQADQLIIGTRPVFKREDAPPQNIVQIEEIPPAEVTPKIVTPKESEPEVKPESTKEEQPKVGLTIKGKIDLETPKKAKSKEKIEEEPTKELKEEVVANKTTKQEKAEIEKTFEATEELVEEKVATDKEPNELIRAKTPQLKGLKILGKIDADKLKKEKKKKKKKEEPLEGMK